MASAFKLVLNQSGVRDLLRSEEVRADLERRGNAIAAAAGAGFVVETWRGIRRYRVMVRTDTEVARRVEATQRVLTRAIDAGR